MSRPESSSGAGGRLDGPLRGAGETGESLEGRLHQGLDGPLRGAGETGEGLEGQEAARQPRDDQEGLDGPLRDAGEMGESLEELGQGEEAVRQPCDDLEEAVRQPCDDPEEDEAEEEEAARQLAATPASTRKAFAELERRAAEAEAALQEQQSELEKAQKECKEMTMARDSAMEQARQAQALFGELTISSDNASAVLETAKAARTARAAAEAAATAEGAEPSVEVLRARIKKLEGELLFISAASDQACTRAANAQAALWMRSSDQFQDKAEFEQTKGQVVELKKEVSRLEQEVARLDEEGEHLGEGLMDAQKLVANMQEALNMAKVAAAHAYMELGKERERTTSLTAQAFGWERRVEAAEIAATEAALAALGPGSGTASSEDVDDLLRRRVRQLEAQLARSESVVNDLQSQAAKESGSEGRLRPVGPGAADGRRPGKWAVPAMQAMMSMAGGVQSVVGCPKRDRPPRYLPVFGAPPAPPQDDDLEYAQPSSQLMRPSD